MQCGARGQRVIQVWGAYEVPEDRLVRLVCTEPADHPPGEHYDETYALEFGPGHVAAAADGEVAVP